MYVWKRNPIEMEFHFFEESSLPKLSPTSQEWHVCVDDVWLDFGLRKLIPYGQVRAQMDPQLVCLFGPKKRSKRKEMELVLPLSPEGMRHTVMFWWDVTCRVVCHVYVCGSSPAYILSYFSQNPRTLIN